MMFTGESGQGENDQRDDVCLSVQDKWLGSCFYDILHPKDITKVKEQLACFDVEEGTHPLLSLFSASL